MFCLLFTPFVIRCFLCTHPVLRGPLHILHGRQRVGLLLEAIATTTTTNSNLTSETMATCFPIRHVMVFCKEMLRLSLFSLESKKNCQ